MRANIYNCHPLSPSVEEAIHDGLGMVAAFVGEKIMARTAQVRVPTESDGRVRPERVGFASMDPMVEMHVMAVPMARSGTRVGLAYASTGVCFVDVSSRSANIVRGIVAHEAAHSLGFVTEQAAQTHASSGGHCRDIECIMHPAIEELTISETIIKAKPQTRMAKLLRREPTLVTESVSKIVSGQIDFCADCKHDMWVEGQKNLNTLRVRRLLDKKILYK